MGACSQCCGDDNSRGYGQPVDPNVVFKNELVYVFQKSLKEVQIQKGTKTFESDLNKLAEAHERAIKLILKNDLYNAPRRSTYGIRSTASTLDSTVNSLNLDEVRDSIPESRKSSKSMSRLNQLNWQYFVEQSDGSRKPINDWSCMIINIQEERIK